MASLYVGNLHPECTEAILYKKFSSAGKIFNIHICRDVDTNQSVGYGYINFARKVDAEKALETMNYDTVNGQALRLMWAKKHSTNHSANLFVKNINAAIDEKSLYVIFANHGHILSLKIETDECGESRGFGFVQFEDEDSANAAIAGLNEKIILGNKMYVSKFIPREKKQENFKNVYLKNFQLSLTDDGLTKLCEKFGKIFSAKVMRDEKGKSKGFGFVCFEEPASAQEAVNDLNGTYLDGKRLFVGRAKKKSERKAEILENLKRKIRQEQP